MPFTVITMSNVPRSLRGDITKWMQEIHTGVYIGNINVRLREKLWDRVISNLGNGRATIAYTARNELGYQFDTFNTEQINMNYDGLPIVMFPNKSETEDILETGFSNASKFQNSKKYTKSRVNIDNKIETSKTYIILDIETDGLIHNENNIIEIAALKIEIILIDNTIVNRRFNEKHGVFHSLVSISDTLPKDIIKLTGITDEELKDKGESISDVLLKLKNFVGSYPILGYNIFFDMRFINQKLKEIGEAELDNFSFDILRLVKKENAFLVNYKLDTVLEYYNIKIENRHRAKSDVFATDMLINKVIKNWDFLN